MALLTTLRGLVDPLLFIAQALATLPAVVARLAARGELAAALLSWPRFSDAWFGTFWLWAGPMVRDTAEARVVPLIQGRVRGGRILSRAEAEAEAGDSGAETAAVRGTVLEVGPGSGMWVSLWSDKYLSSSHEGSGPDAGAGLVTKVYGVEPNPDQHPGLRRRVQEAGLEDVYEIVPLGIQDLAQSGRVPRESIDCIVTVMCLCSIPDPELNIRELYGYLRKGGRWYVYEHVKCSHASQGWAMVAYQRVLDLVWPWIMGGCHLQRESGKTIEDAGPWSKVDVTAPADEPWYAPLPHAYGVLTK